MYQVGDVTTTIVLLLNQKTGLKPMDYALEDFFGSSPKTIMTDKTVKQLFRIRIFKANIPSYLNQVLQLEAVACKDWLTNKVDRCVGVKLPNNKWLAKLQLPLK
jgi:phosphoribosylformylglycinamidine synthase